MGFLNNFANMSVTAQTVILMLAVLPVIALMILIYKMDSYEKEPKLLLLAVFGMGCLSVLPTMLFEILLQNFFIALFRINFNDYNFMLNVAYNGYTWLYLFVNCMIAVALVEEFFKWFMQFIITWKNKNFNYKYDAIVYSCFSALGFAFVEDIKYLVMAPDTWKTGLVRAITAVPMHFICAVYMGIWYGKAKYAKATGRGSASFNIIMGLLLSTGIHGFYDFCLFTNNTFMTVLCFTLLVFLDVFTLVMIIRNSKKNHALYNNSASFRLGSHFQTPGMVYRGQGTFANAMPMYGQPAPYGMSQPMPNGMGAPMYGQPMPNGMGAPMYGQPVPNGMGQPPINQPINHPVKASKTVMENYNHLDQSRLRGEAGYKTILQTRHINCPSCQLENDFNALYCVYCGKPLHNQ